MERIIIKSIDKKPSGLVIVGYNGNREATMNTKWQAQEVAYFEIDVGIGGSVECEIVQKGEYTNITKVNFASAQKNPNYSQTIPVEEIKIANTPKETMGSNKDDKIIAQVILKGAVELAKVNPTTFSSNEALGEYLCMAVNELTGAYKLALSNLQTL